MTKITSVNIVLLMFKKIILTLIVVLFINTNANSNSCVVLYPELLEIVENSTLPQDKIDEAKALIDEGWALHKELEDAPDDDRHYEALDILFAAYDILETE